MNIDIIFLIGRMYWYLNLKHHVTCLFRGTEEEEDDDDELEVKSIQSDSDMEVEQSHNAVKTDSQNSVQRTEFDWLIDLHKTETTDSVSRLVSRTTEWISEIKTWYLQVFCGFFLRTGILHHIQKLRCWYHFNSCVVQTMFMTSSYQARKSWSCLRLKLFHTIKLWSLRKERSLMFS